MKEKIFKKGLTKRLFSVVLALAMVMTLMPMNTLTVEAAGSTPGGSTLPTQIFGFDVTWNGSWHIANEQYGTIGCEHGETTILPGDDGYIMGVLHNGSYVSKSDLTAGTYTGALPMGPDDDEPTACGCTFTLSTPGGSTHTHGTWNYEVENTSTLKATCGNEGCTETPYSVSLTLTASSANYSGSPVSKATLFGGMDFTEFNTATKLNLTVADIKIYASDDTSKATPFDEINAAGSYVADLTVDTDKTATLNFNVVEPPTFPEFSEHTGCQHSGASAHLYATGVTYEVDGSVYVEGRYWGASNIDYYEGSGNNLSIAFISTEGGGIGRGWYYQDGMSLKPCVLEHTHTDHYGVTTTTTANDTLTWYCGAGCPSGAVDAAHAVKLTLTASSANYSGSAAKITVGTTTEQNSWTSAGLTIPTTISYAKTDGTALSEAPTTAGSYTASVTVGTATASVSYTIEQAHEADTTKYSHDDTNHWRPCVVTGCTNAEHKYSTAAHSYDQTSHKCVCGKVDPKYHQHSYSAWSKNATNHWKECTDSNCPEQDKGKTDEAAHTWGAWNSSTGTRSCTANCGATDTCNHNGATTGTCSTCGKRLSSGGGSGSGSGSGSGGGSSIVNASDVLGDIKKIENKFVASSQLQVKIFLSASDFAQNKVDTTVNNLIEAKQSIEAQSDFDRISTKLFGYTVTKKSILSFLQRMTLVLYL